MQHVDSDYNSSDYEAIFHDDFTDIDSSSDIEEIMNYDSDEENKLLYLTKMGYSEAKASITMEICGFPKNHTRGVQSARDMFPGSINVLSLFSMISDTEVVFYFLGIHLKTYVQEHSDQLEQLMSRFGEFNLVVDGIHCNDLTGRNKPH
ncbi:hypothetical protein F3Y22_tig00111837pilonHSYRG00138 [Hibiscus syriacus]|uniref:DNA (Cytosine-5)-methyltransferase DRM1/2 n=1 Tax=Hibiscus syriacus TaxID=106335 RepID=A0A6A2YEC7_HIBSY|nr:hypothetical protein F3Y22_tig00111837pilonHSYRG00138 [Hibiscus syriacus]